MCGPAEEEALYPRRPRDLGGSSILHAVPTRRAAWADGTHARWPTGKLYDGPAGDGGGGHGEAGTGVHREGGTCDAFAPNCF